MRTGAQSAVGGADHDEGVANDQPHRCPTRGAERQANANLLRSLGDDKRHDAMQADRREQQRYHGEAG